MHSTCVRHSASLQKTGECQWQRLATLVNEVQPVAFGSTERAPHYACNGSLNQNILHDPAGITREPALF